MSVYRAYGSTPTGVSTHAHGRTIRRNEIRRLGIQRNENEPSAAGWGGGRRLLAANRRSACSLTRAMDGRILHCGISLAHANQLPLPSSGVAKIWTYGDLGEIWGKMSLPHHEGVRICVCVCVKTNVLCIFDTILRRPTLTK